MRTKQWISLALAFLFMLSGLTACKASEPQAAPTATAAPAAAADATAAPQQENASALPIVKDTLVIDWMCNTHATKTFSGEEPIVKELEKRTNIDLNYKMVPETAYDEQFLITLTSGKLPDLMTATLDDAKKYGMEGAFLPLNDLLEQYGQNILKAIEEEGVMGDIAAADGNIYCLPKFGPYQKCRTFMIRKDWLDKLNLSVPTTLDELYTVLKAFKDNNMGGDMTIPFSAYGLNLLENIFVIFDAQNDSGTFVPRDGKYIYSPASDNMKQAITYLNKLYSEGLLDQEFMTLSKKQWEERANMGVAGVIAYSANRIDTFNKLYQQSDPAAEFIPMLPPAAPDGVIRTYSNESKLSKSYNTVIASSSKHAKEIVQLFNYVFSEEGRILFTYGIEGDSYTMVDGQPRYTDNVLKNSKAEQEYALFGRRMPVWPYDTSEETIGGTSEYAAYEMNLPYAIPSVPILTFTKEEQDVLKKYQTSVEDKKDSYLLQFITGAQPLSNWDQYVSELSGLGLEKCLEVYNAAYARYLSAK